MSIRKLTTGTIVLASALTLSACSDDDDEDAAATTTAITTDQVTESADDPDAEVEAARDLFIGALDDLGIEHTEPVRGQQQLGDVEARFDLTVNGYDTGINVFPDAEVMADWEETSGTLDEIYVAKDLAVLSFNTEEGAADAVEIVPRIAERINGTAHGI